MKNRGISDKVHYMELFMDLVKKHKLTYTIPTVSHPTKGGINFAFNQTPKQDYERLKEWCRHLPPDQPPITLEKDHGDHLKPPTH